MTMWLMSHIQFACEPPCCLLCSCVFLLTYKKQSLATPVIRPAWFSLFSQHQMVRGAMSRQDATLTEGKGKWSHLSPTRSWKEMRNSERKHWCAFLYISAESTAARMPLIKTVALFSSPLPLWHQLWHTLAASSLPSCEQMGGTEQTNMSAQMVYGKKK